RGSLDRVYRKCLYGISAAIPLPVEIRGEGFWPAVAIRASIASDVSSANSRWSARPSISSYAANAHAAKFCGPVHAKTRGADPRGQPPRGQPRSDESTRSDVAAEKQHACADRRARLSTRTQVRPSACYADPRAFGPLKADRRFHTTSTCGGWESTYPCISF